LYERRDLTIGPDETLADFVHKEIRALITDGKLEPHSRLPSESELARRFSISRPVIRQALARLRSEGLIVSRQGSGSYVRSASGSEQRAKSHIEFPAISSIADLDSFLSFGEGFEGEAAATAARQRTPDQLDAIRVVFEQFSRHGGAQEACDLDYAFHLAVAKASGNPFYVNGLESLREHIMFGIRLAWTFAGNEYDFSQVISNQHRAILDAIADQDAEAARAAMRTHLSWARSRLLTGHVAS